MTAHDPTYAALLSAILARPDDDLPRLVMADWLDENGMGERAEFVRAQVRLALPYRTCSVRCSHEYGHMSPCEIGEIQSLQERVQELWLSHVDRWFPFAEYGHALLTPPNETERRNGHTVSVLRRGFVESVYGPLDQLRRHLPAIVAVEPVERVEVSGKEPSVLVHKGHIWWDVNRAADIIRPPVLPTDVFNSLEGDVEYYNEWMVGVGDLFPYKSYPTRDLATAALSAALLLEARAAIPQPV